MWGPDLILQYFLGVWLISVISPRPLSGQTPAKLPLIKTSCFLQFLSLQPPLFLPLPYFFPLLVYRDICSSPHRTLLLLYFKRERTRKKNVFYCPVCWQPTIFTWIVWNEAPSVCYVMFVMVRHLKSVCSNLSIYMFDLVGVKRQWLLCILWLLRGMQIDDISWYNNSNRNTLYLWYKQHQRNLLLTHPITAKSTKSIFILWIKDCFSTLYYYIYYIRLLWDKLSYQGIYRRIRCDKNNYWSDWKALEERDISDCGPSLVIFRGDLF